VTLPDLKLEWQRCPNGVEVIDRAPTPPGTEIVRSGLLPIRRKVVPTLYDKVSDGWHFRFKSPDRERFLQTLNLEEPVVVRFINATTVDSLIPFFMLYGLPDGGDETSVEVETTRRSGLTRILEKAVSGNPSRAGPAIAKLSKDIQLRPTFDGEPARLVLQVGSLRDFMAMEILLAGVAGVRHGRCRACGRLFLTGPETGGRLTRQFCNAGCRQRGFRKTQNGG